MMVRVKLSAFKQSHWYEHVVRFALGGLATVVAGLVADIWGPESGGLFLAFPAIFCASATLIEKHERGLMAKYYPSPAASKSFITLGVAQEHVALLWHPGRMLLAGDVCTNLMGLGDPVGFESLEQGRASQRKLASLSFDAIGFGNGKPIARDASAHFR
jgi:hypothetical protein